MAFDDSALATSMRDALGFQDQPVSKQTKDEAKAILKQLTQNGVVSFSPGGITGTCPGGGPLAEGAGTGGKISGLSDSELADDLAGAFGGPATAQVKDFASSVCTHLQTAQIVFSKGAVTGACSNTATSPGAVVAVATGGKITGLDGASLAQLIATKSYGGKVTPQLQAKCQAITDHVTLNGEAYFLTGITGVAPAGGGDMEQGTGAGGKLK